MKSGPYANVSGPFHYWPDDHWNLCRVMLAIPVKGHYDLRPSIKRGSKKGSQGRALSQITRMADYDRPEGLCNFGCHVLRSIIANYDLVYIFLRSENDSGDRLFLIIRWYARYNHLYYALPLPSQKERVEALAF